MNQNIQSLMNPSQQALPTEAFVLPELTLIPFEPGQHMVTIARMDRPFRDIGGTTFPNVLISVLPGPGQATIDNAKSFWLTTLGESVVIDVQIPGAILVFLTIRPTDYETTGLYIQIKKIEAKQDVAQPVQVFGQPQGQPAGAFSRPGEAPFGHAEPSSPQHVSSPVSPFSTSAHFGGTGTQSPFAAQATTQPFQGQPGFAPQQPAGPGQSPVGQPASMPPFGAKPSGQMESLFAQASVAPQTASAFAQTNPSFPGPTHVFNAQAESMDGKNQFISPSPAPQPAVAPSGQPAFGANLFGEEPPHPQGQQTGQGHNPLPQSKPFANVFGAGIAKPGQEDGKNNPFSYYPGTKSESLFSGAPQPGGMPFGQIGQPNAQPQGQNQAASCLPLAKPFANVLGNGNPHSGSEHGKTGAFAYTTPAQQTADPSVSTQAQPLAGVQSAKPFKPFAPSAQPTPEIAPVQVHACGHIQNKGDVPCSPGQSVGTPSSQLRLEAMAFKPEGIDPAQFEYATVSHDGRLSPWTSFPHFSGSRGSSMPLLGFVARLTGDAAEKYQVVYSGTFLKAGQAPEARDGQFLHSPIQGDALESLSLRIVPKN